jgi:hypothetical protein
MSLGGDHSRERSSTVSYGQVVRTERWVLTQALSGGAMNLYFTSYEPYDFAVFQGV